MPVDLTPYLQELVTIACNACGSSNYTTLAQREKYNLPIPTVICRNCGLIFLNPRPSPKMYNRLNTADYRRAAIGTDSGLDRIFRKQYHHAQKTMIPFISPHLASNPPSSLLDIGCCNGGTMAAWQKSYPDITAVGIEPVINVANDASRRTNRPVHKQPFEHYQTKTKFDLIICAQTLNHTLDPLSNLRKMKSLLTPRGILFISLFDSVSTLLNRSINNMTEIMHPYMFSPETITYILERAELKPLTVKHKNLDGGTLTKKDIYKVICPRILVVAKATTKALTPTKPDFNAIKQRIARNVHFHQQWSNTINKWKQPDLARRICQVFYPHD